MARRREPEFKIPRIFGTVVTKDGSGSDVLGSVYTVKRAGDEQWLDYEEEVRAQHWNYDWENRKEKMREEKRRQEREAKKEKKKEFNRRVNQRNWFEQEEKERKKKEKAATLWQRANVRKVRDDWKRAVAAEAMKVDDPRRELERKNFEKEERLQYEARVAEVKHMKWKLHKARREAEKKQEEEEEKRKKREERRELERMLAQEEEEDSIAVGADGAVEEDGGGEEYELQKNKGEFGWSSSSASTVSQEEREGREWMSMVRASEVTWQPIEGSLWWKGRQMVDGRRVEVLRPRMYEKGHPEAERKMARMYAIRRNIDAGSG